MLANRAMQNHSEHAHFVDELMHHIPRFQYGMDVNPKFTAGVSGYEYTSELTAFDMLQVKLVHGWLVDPQQDETYAALGSKTYNEVVEWVIKGNEASGELEKVQKALFDLKSERQRMGVDLLDDSNTNNNINKSTKIEEKIKKKEAKLEKLKKTSLRGRLMNNFLQFTGHQLTQFGLQTLHETLKDDELCVFFRNNHFGTLTKHEGLLYLLVTDLGYANAPAIVWEKLDVIDGDTEYVNSSFLAPSTSEVQIKSGSTLSPEQLMAQSGQNDADFNLAMQLSLQDTGRGGQSSLDQQEGELMKAATEASLREFNSVKSKPPTSAPKASASSKASQKEKVEVGVPLGQPMPAKPTFVEMPPESAPPRGTSQAPVDTQEEADRQLALQLQGDGDDGPQEVHDPSLHLAMQLQREEDQRAALARHEQRQARAVSKRNAPKDANCVIS